MFRLSSCVCQECETWLNIAVCQEEMGEPMEKTDASYTAALSCAERSGVKLQVSFSLPAFTFHLLFFTRRSHCLCVQRRVLRAWLQAQRRCGSSQSDDTEARLQELCERDGRSLEESDDDDDDEEELENSEPLEDSDIQCSDSEGNK